jgi:protein tyrosine phosphatase
VNILTQVSCERSSAGVGRTGTVILVHACCRMAEVENAVDPLALMSKMRSQRPNMVDNQVYNISIIYYH